MGLQRQQAISLDTLVKCFVLSASWPVEINRLGGLSVPAPDGGAGHGEAGTYI